MQFRNLRLSLIFLSLNVAPALTLVSEETTAITGFMSLLSAGVGAFLGRSEAAGSFFTRFIFHGFFAGAAVETAAVWDKEAGTEAALKPFLDGVLV